MQQTCVINTGQTFSTVAETDRGWVLTGVIVPSTIDGAYLYIGVDDKGTIRAVATEQGTVTVALNSFTKGRLVLLPPVTGPTRWVVATSSPQAADRTVTLVFA
jgi:hypothetical protein